MREHQSDDDPERLLKRQYRAPTPPDSFLRDLDARVREELELRNRNSATFAAGTDSNKGLRALARKGWPFAAAVAACVLVGMGIWLLGPKQDESRQIAMVDSDTSDSEQPGAPEPDARGSLEAGLVKNKAEEDRARYGYLPPNGASAGAVRKPPSAANMGRSSPSYAVEITTADRVSKASAIVRVQFIGLDNNKRGRWQVKKVLHGRVDADIVVSRSPVSPTTAPELFASTGHEFPVPDTRRPAAPRKLPHRKVRHEAVLYLGECSESDDQGAVQCELKGIQYAAEARDLDDVEAKIQQIIESGEHLTPEPGDEPELPDELKANSERSD